MGEGRSSGSREMRGGRQSWGGGTSEHVNKLNILLLFVYTTTREGFVIFTRRYFKF